ncbi:MAG: bifunctional nuclease family protein [Candidatus Aminicenantes bacterium]|nr:bifunctional nuclease family protein [Candidatus Aminicenantes bacterium]
MEKLIKVNLVGLILDPVSKAPVMILRPPDENKFVPIWIGGYEADAITMELENIRPPRPMTHDLLKDILFHLNAEVEKVVVTDIVDNTYYAELYIRSGAEISVIDCRPSDAVALSLKNRAAIYITESVYRSSMLSDFFANFVHSEEKLEKWFNSLSVEDFGNVEQ